jgi:hypothetical protein
LIVTVAVGLAGPASASAMTIVERPVSSETRTFRSLQLLADPGEPNRLSLGLGDSITVFEQVSIGAIPSACYRNSSTSAICPRSAYDLIFVDLGDGEDVMDTAFGYPALTRAQIDSPDVPVFVNVLLGPGDDEFEGVPPGTDYVAGQGGRDRILGGPSNDLLEGGPGRDLVIGGSGLDFLYGGRGGDYLYGAGGTPDLMVGGRGPDRCVGNRKDRVAGCERIEIG